MSRIYRKCKCGNVLVAGVCFGCDQPKDACSCDESTMIPFHLAVHSGSTRGHAGLG